MAYNTILKINTTIINYNKKSHYHCNYNYYQYLYCFFFLLIYCHYYYFFYCFIIIYYNYIYLLLLTVHHWIDHAYYQSSMQMARKGIVLLGSKKVFYPHKNQAWANRTLPDRHTQQPIYSQTVSYGTAADRLVPNPI